MQRIGAMFSRRQPSGAGSRRPRAGTAAQGDTKEGLYIGREIHPSSPEASLPLHGVNQWPAQVPLPTHSKRLIDRRALMSRQAIADAVRCEHCGQRVSASGQGNAPRYCRKFWCISWPQA